MTRRIRPLAERTSCSKYLIVCATGSTASMKSENPLATEQKYFAPVSVSEMDPTFPTDKWVVPHRDSQSTAIAAQVKRGFQLETKAASRYWARRGNQTGMAMVLSGAG